MKKIVFIVPSINKVGGAQKMAKFVIDSVFNDAKHEVFLVPQQKSRDELSFNNNVSIIHLKHNINGPIPRLKRMVIRLLATCEIRRIVRSLSPDLIVIFGITSSSLLALKGKRYNKVYCERGDPFSYPKYLQKLLKKSVQDYRALILQSEGAKSFFTFFSNDKMRVIPNPCLVDSPPTYGGNFDSQILISAGRFVSEKRFDFIIEAFFELKKRYRDLVLRIYGDGEERENLLQLISEKGLEKSVYLFSGTNDLLKEISKAKLFLFASTFEGLPNVVIESCGIGIPCVCTNCSPGGVDYLTESGKVGGKMVGIDDFYGFVNACSDLIENKNEYLHYSISGVAFRKRFNKKVIITKWRNAFSDIVD